MSEWRTRKRGSPSQVGAKFPLSGSGTPEYQPRGVTVFRTSSAIQTNISKAYSDYLSMMSDPAFSSRSLQHRIDVVAERNNLDPYEKTELSEIVKKEEDKARNFVESAKKFEEERASQNPSPNPSSIFPMAVKKENEPLED